MKTNVDIKIENWIKNYILSCLEEGRKENYIFRHGYDSSYSYMLERGIEGFGDDFLKELKLAFNSIEDEDIISEGLSVLGRNMNAETAETRRVFIEEFLKSSNYVLRDEACLALDSLDNKKSIPAIEEAVKIETNKHLREYMLKVVEGLKER